MSAFVAADRKIPSGESGQTARMAPDCGRRLLYLAGHILGGDDLPCAVTLEPGVGPGELDRVFPPVGLGARRAFATIQNGHGITKEVHLHLKHGAAFLSAFFAEGLGKSLLLGIERSVRGGAVKVVR